MRKERRSGVMCAAPLRIKWNSLLHRGFWCCSHKRVLCPNGGIPLALLAEVGVQLDPSALRADSCFRTVAVCSGSIFRTEYRESWFSHRSECWSLYRPAAWNQPRKGSCRWSSSSPAYRSCNLCIVSFCMLLFQKWDRLAVTVRSWVDSIKSQSV